MKVRLLLACIFMLALLSCSGSPSVSQTDPSPVPSQGSVTATNLVPTAPPPTPSPAPLMNVVSATPRPVATPTANVPTVCPPTWCAWQGGFPLARPVSPPARDSIDPSYRFGTTQGGVRDPHHGVEFLNTTGTVVQAAKDGEVIVAGNDLKTRYSPYYNFYGNLVVIKHQIPGIAQPVFTLYAHLSKILVAIGDHVSTGDEIGLVGMSGSATGSHLHFEVRLGENTYEATRNPELWLQPEQGEGKTPLGAIAGVIQAPPGTRLEIPSIVLEQMGEPGQAAIARTYLTIYEEQALVGQPPWGESFAAGGLAPGWYRVAFVQFGLQEQVVQVIPNQVVRVIFDLRDGG